MRRTDVSKKEREQYLKEIRELYRTLGRPPKMKEYTRAKEAVIIWGGSWRSVLREAGCQGNLQGFASDEEIKEKYFQLKRELGRQPKSSEFTPYYQMLYRRYGSWKAWLKKIGESNERTEEDLIKILRTFYEEHGRSPSGKEVPYSGTIREQLGQGRWCVALKRAGLPVTGTSRHTNAELIAKIKEKAKELGRCPSVRELPEGITIVRRFGTWREALVYAGVNQKRKTYSRQAVIRNEDILLELQVLMLKNNRAPYYREYDHAGLCIKRFGRWNTAIEEAKRDPYNTMERARALAMSSNT